MKTLETLTVGDTVYCLYKEPLICCEATVSDIYLSLNTGKFKISIGYQNFFASNESVKELYGDNVIVFLNKEDLVSHLEKLKQVISTTLENLKNEV